MSDAVPSTLDRRSRYSERTPLEPCSFLFVLGDGSSEPCDGREGHDGPHHARVTVTRERVEGESYTRLA